MSRGRKKHADHTKVYRSRAFTKLKKLNEAAASLVEEKAKEIAQSLYDSSAEGHMQSIQVLADLAEGNVEAEEAIELRPPRSWAMDLATDPEWPGMVDEEPPETGVGRREPKAA